MLALPAQAQMACDDRADVLRHLSSKYHEAPVALGVANNGGLVELLTTDGGSTWTLIITYGGKRTCLLAAGESWERIPAPAFGEKMALRVSGQPRREWRTSDEIAFHHFCIELDDAQKYIGLLTTEGPDEAQKFWSSAASSCWQSVMPAHGQLVAPASPVFRHGTQSFRIWEVKVLDLFFRAAGFPQRIFVLLLDQAPGEPT